MKRVHKALEFVAVVAVGVALTPVCIRYAALERGYSGAVGLECAMWLLVPAAYYAAKGAVADARRMWREIGAE